MDARDRSRSPRGGLGDPGMTDEDIVALVVQRERARLSKDWAQADVLRDQLRQAGVTLFDNTNAWRTADGRSGRIPTWSELEGGTANPATLMADPAALNFVTGTVGDVNIAHIKQLVQMREQARAQKDFAQSDKIRDELKIMGVELYDKEKMWRAKSGESGCIIGFRGSAGPTDMEISLLVAQRERARQSGDWASADMIRDELKQFGVVISDQEKVWHCPDGRRGMVPSWGAQVARGGMPAVTVGALPPMPQMIAAPHQPPPPPPAALPMAQTANVQQQLLQAAVQAAQNPITAARTLALMQQGGVAPVAVHHPVTVAPAPAVVARVPPPPMAPVVGMQPTRLQTVMPGPTVPVVPGGKSQEAIHAFTFVQQCQAAGRSPTDQEIEWLVYTREKVRQQRDFTTADELRNAMRNSFGIELHEKEKFWSTPDGRQGLIPPWHSLQA